MTHIPDDRVARARAVRLEDEAARRGIKLRKGYRNAVELVGPCPVCCDGDDRFSINARKQVCYCRICGLRGDVIAFVQAVDGCGFAEAVATLTGADQARPQAAPPPARSSKPDAATYERDQHRKAAWLWSRRRPIAGTIAETYLRGCRGIACELPATLAFLPPSKPEHHPALISAFALAEDATEPRVLDPPQDVDSVHLTLLQPDGSDKASVEPNKIMIGRSLGLPITLAPPNDGLALCITEGIEDALSAREALGIGAWAAGAAGRMPALADVVPSFIEAVIILVDPDPAGRRGGTDLAARLRERTRRGLPSIEVLLRELA